MSEPHSTSDGAPRALRSARWFEAEGVAGLIHRASMRAEGLTSDTLRGRPVIGICNCWSELVSCNLHFRALANHIKRGVFLAGGLPLEFPVITLGENLMKPTAMLYRNLMAMDVEECIRAYPFDAVVLLGGCDKTIPAQLMGAASAGVPAIMVTGGPSSPARFQGEALGNGTDLWKLTDGMRAGEITAETYIQFEESANPTVGHCTELGTASTMAAIAEAIGMALRGSSTIPAVHAARSRAGEITGRTAVTLARESVTPAQVMTMDAFDNAVTTLLALGGSTNAVVHLLALAGRLGIELNLRRINELSARTPVLVDVRPVGHGLFEDLHEAGGIPAVHAALGDLIREDVMTVSDFLPAGAPRTLAPASPQASRVIRPADEPLVDGPSLSIVWGSLAPRGAVIKRAAASPELLVHAGPALVFDGIDDLLARIEDPNLPVDAATVLILRGAGPIGGPGMPEWGQIPIPSKLLREGVRDMVRISDARMSGTAFGTTVLHAAPESAAGGPLAAVKDGDIIRLDVPAGTLDIDVSAEELQRRLDALTRTEPRAVRGYGKLYAAHVNQADQGCDFDFLRATSDDVPAEPYVLAGWVGGW